MKATIQNGNLQRVLGGLQTVAAWEIPVKLALKLRRMVREMTTILEDFEAERQKIIRQYAMMGEAGEPLAQPNGSVVFPDDGGKSSQQCFKEIAELVQLPTEELPVILWSEFGPRFLDDERTDHQVPKGLATVLLLLDNLFSEDEDEEN